MRKTILFLILFVCLVALPLSLWWWLYFILAFAMVFITGRTYLTLFAGAVLDVVYFSGFYGYLPLMTLGGLVISVVYLTVEDKLRFNAFQI